MFGALAPMISPGINVDRSLALRRTELGTVMSNLVQIRSEDPMAAMPKSRHRQNETQIGLDPDVP